MGASHSTINDQDHPIPVELVIKILLNLSVAQLTSCRCVSRALHDIIDASPHIQHQIATALAGVVDNLSAALSLPERRRALARKQEAWDNYRPQFTTSSKVPRPYFPDFIQDGVYFKLHHPDFRNCVGYCYPPQPKHSFDGSWSCISPLPKQLHCELIAVAVCLEKNDLIAVGIRHGNLPPWSDTYTPPSDYSAYTLVVDLLSFSLGGQHPSAREPTLIVRDVSEAGRVQLDLDLEIRNDLLAVLVPGKELFIFAWKTGQNIACIKDRYITAFRFLSDAIIIIADITKPYWGSLDLFAISDHTGQVPITQVARLWLDEDYPISNVEFVNRAAKNGVVRSNLQIDDAEHYIKPFTSSPDSLIYISITTRSSEDEQGYDFVVHSSALLHHVKGQHFDSIRWKVWGLMATLSICSAYTPANLCGQRLLMGNGEIWDFNQYRVKQLGKGFAVETEMTDISVIAKKEELPYVRIMLIQRPPLDYGASLCLDDDRILTCTRDGEVDHIFFG